MFHQDCDDRRSNQQPLDSKRFNEAERGDILGLLIM
jgi:hypothetical protein